jgi:hypothetical protein
MLQISLLATSGSSNSARLDSDVIIWHPYEKFNRMRKQVLQPNQKNIFRIDSCSRRSTAGSTCAGGNNSSVTMTVALRAFICYTLYLSYGTFFDPLMFSIFVFLFNFLISGNVAWRLSLNSAFVSGRVV